MVVDYKLAKVYKLESPSGLVYIGSTCQNLAVRKAGHKRSYLQWKKGKKQFTSSFKLFDEDKDNIEIFLIENFPCNTKEELHSREGHWIKSTNCVNKVIAGRKKKQWTIDNKDKIKQYKEKYTEKIKDIIVIVKKEAKTKANADYGVIYRKNNLEHIKEFQKKYRIVNAEKIKAHKNAKTLCECGSTYTNAHKTRHLRTNKHQEFIKDL
jgi:hypothetical protein